MDALFHSALAETLLLASSRGTMLDPAVCSREWLVVVDSHSYHYED